MSEIRAPQSPAETPAEIAGGEGRDESGSEIRYEKARAQGPGPSPGKHLHSDEEVEPESMVAGRGGTAQLLGTTALARRLGVHPDTVRKWRTRHDDFPAPAYESDRLLLWNIDEVREWRRPRQEKKKLEREKRYRHENAAQIAKSARRYGQHGTRANYVRGCRCEACTAANAAYIAEYKARRKRKSAKKRGAKRR